MTSRESLDVFDPTSVMDHRTRHESDSHSYISFETVIKISVYRGEAPGSVLMFDVTPVNEAVSTALDLSLYDQYTGTNTYNGLNTDKRIEYKFQEVVDMSASGCVVNMIYDITLKIPRDDTNEKESMTNEYKAFTNTYIPALFLQKAQSVFDKLYAGEIRYTGTMQGLSDYGSEYIKRTIFREIDYKNPVIKMTETKIVAEENHSYEDEYERPRLLLSTDAVMQRSSSNSFQSLISWHEEKFSWNNSLYLLVSFSACFLVLLMLRWFGKWRKPTKNLTHSSVSIESKQILPKPALVSTVSSSSTSSTASYDRKLSPRADPIFKEPKRVTVSPRLALNPTTESFSLDSIDEESSVGSYSASSSMAPSSGEATPSENQLQIPDLNLDMSLINEEEEVANRKRLDKPKKKGTKGQKKRRMKPVDTELVTEEAPVEAPVSSVEIVDESYKPSSPVRPCVINIHIKSSPEKTAKSNV